MSSGHPTFCFVVSLISCDSSVTQVSTPRRDYLLSCRRFLGPTDLSPAQITLETVQLMSNSKFFDTKGNCSNKIGDHCHDQNHGLVNNQILDPHQLNQLLDDENMCLDAPTNGVHFPVGANTFSLAMSPFQSMSAQVNQNQSAQPEDNCSNEIGDHCHDQNHGLVNNQILDPHQLNQPLDDENMCLDAPTNGVHFPVGSNTFSWAVLPNHASFQSMSAQINQNQLAQSEGPGNMVNPYISPQINLNPLAMAGSSQSSNISIADLQKKIKKQESDRKSRAKKEKIRKDTEENLVKVTKENNQLRKENGSLKAEQATMKNELKNLEEKVNHLEKEVSYSYSKLKGHNSMIDALSDKLVASSECADLVLKNKELKRKIELLLTQLENPDGVKILQLHEEIDKWKRKAKRVQIINEALCDKMNNDEQ